MSLGAPTVVEVPCMLHRVSRYCSQFTMNHHDIHAVRGCSLVIIDSKLRPNAVLCSNDREMPPTTKEVEAKVNPVFKGPPAKRPSGSGEGEGGLESGSGGGPEMLDPLSCPRLPINLCQSA